MTKPEVYQPTPEERLRANGVSDELKLSGDGIFATLQGEGVSAGRPSVFLRLQNCNLHCGKDGLGWQCDAWYTWDSSSREYWQETRLASINLVADEIKNAWDENFTEEALTPNLVITGGEPLLQQKKLALLLPLLTEWTTEIETNGTILPSYDFRDSQINCSPKLASSGNALHARQRLKVLQGIATFPNYWLKFVIKEETDIAEMKQVVQIANDGDYSRVILMGEGVVASELNESLKRLHDLAQKLGCAVTARNHIYWYGDKRAT